VLVAIAHSAGGNFRLVQRLFSHFERVMQISQLRMISQEAVEVARACLVIGPTG
jgi:hypothetical protein